MGGGAGERIISSVDEQIRRWLDVPEVVINPDRPNEEQNCILSLSPDTCTYTAASAASSSDSGHDSSYDDNDQLRPEPSPTILQIARHSHSLIWQVQDNFVRFLVHAVARYYHIVSFTKVASSSSPHTPTARSDDQDQRLVYLLRPNMQSTRTVVSNRVHKGIDTPPSTEWEASSEAGSASGSSVSSRMDSLGESVNSEESAYESGENDDTAWDILSLDTDEAGDQTHNNDNPIPVLSDIDSIDSGEEVDDEGMAFSRADSDSLASSFADLSLHPSSRSRSPSRSRSLPPLSLLNRQRGRTSVKGRNSMTRQDRTKAVWKLPELTFIQWIMAS